MGVGCKERQKTKRRLYIIALVDYHLPSHLRLYSRYILASLVLKFKICHKGTLSEFFVLLPQLNEMSAVTFIENQPQSPLNRPTGRRFPVPHKNPIWSQLTEMDFPQQDDVLLWALASHPFKVQATGALNHVCMKLEYQ